MKINGAQAETLLGRFDRGYSRRWPTLPLADQEKALIRAGLKAGQIYVEGGSAECLAALVKATRKGQLIGVFGGLRVFGETHRQITAAVTAIEEAGGIVVDVETGDRSDRHGVRMLSRALARVRGEATMGDRAAEIGALGGAARGKALREKRMPEDEARPIWRDRSIDTATALSRMPGWTKPTAQRHLGKTKRRKGPFRSQQATG